MSPHHPPDIHASLIPRAEYRQVFQCYSSARNEKFRQGASLRARRLLSIHAFGGQRTARPTSFNPNFEMGLAAVSNRSIIAMQHKAVLKHTQSRRWREVWCGPSGAKRLDCVRLIAALSRSFPTPSAAKTLQDCMPASEFGFNPFVYRLDNPKVFRIFFAAGFALAMKFRRALIGCEN
jgi:hypothetical protein